MENVNDNVMNILKVKVEGLFFEENNFEIRFDKAISIIVAGNGFGKTTTLRMIDAFLNKKLHFFTDVVFKSFTVFFNNGTKVTLKCENKEGNFEGRLKLSSNKNKPVAVTFEKHKKEERFPWLLNRDKNDEYEIVENHPEWFDNLKLVNDLFVDTNRLWIKKSDDLSRHSGELVPAIELYSDEMKKLISDVRSASVSNAAEIDSKLAVDVFQQFVNGRPQKAPSLKEIINLLEDFEKKRSELNKYGLLLYDKKDDEKFAKAVGGMNKANKELFNSFVHLFISSRLEKYNFFNEFLSKLKVLQDVINDKFNKKENFPETFFTSKKFSINDSEGFVVEMEKNKKKIPIQKLSSGEQQEIVMIYQLLFKSRANQIVLIDEPEISLHVAWQRSFINDLKKVSNLTGVKFLIATHSPDIIDSNWELVQELPYASK